MTGDRGSFRLDRKQPGPQQPASEEPHHARHQARQGSVHPVRRQAARRLMDQAGIDVLLANSKHNVQYLLGGHRSIFFDYMDAMGISRYLPIVVYPKGGREKAAYFGHRLEKHQNEVAPFWTSPRETTSGGSLDAMEKAVDYLRRAGIATRNRRRDAVPAGRRGDALRGAFAKRGQNALFVLERLRAQKRPDELALLRESSERVIEAMQAVIAKTRPGMTKQELVEALRREEVSRGLTFEYCLMTAGTSLNRAPSDTALGQGRYHVARLGRQLSRLYRRPVPHGHPSANPMRSSRICWARSRRSSARPSSRSRPALSAAAIYAAADPLLQEVASTRTHALPGARHGPGQSRGAAAHGQRTGATMPTTPSGRSRPAWWSRSRPRCSTRAAASSSWRTRSR